MVSRMLREHETVGSNPTVPTKFGGSMILEIRAAEGGEDARLLVEEQTTIYARVATRGGL